MPEILPSAEVARRVARTGIEEADGQEPFEVADERWLSALDLLGHQRLTGLGIEAADRGVLKLSDRQLRELVERHREAMVHAIWLERKMLALAAAFDAASLDLIVLKGPAVAHVFYPDPSWRPFGDLDLLVRTRQWGPACTLLADHGFRRKYEEPRPGFVERFGHTALHVDAHGFELDLHRTLIAGPFGQWVDHEELFGRTAGFAVGGRPLRRLNDTLCLLHACIHASLGHRPPLLIPLRDVLQTARAAIDWRLLQHLAERWKLRAVVRHAMTTARETLGGALPPEAALLVDERASRRERRALAAYATDRRTRGGKSLATIRAIPGLREKGAYVRALVFPSRRFLAARARNGRPSYLRRWMTPVRWIARRHG